MKLTRVTPAGLEVFGEVPTAFEFLVSEPPSQKNSNGNFKLYIKISKGITLMSPGSIANQMKGVIKREAL